MRLYVGSNLIMAMLFLAGLVVAIVPSPEADPEFSGTDVSEVYEEMEVRLCASLEAYREYSNQLIANGAYVQLIESAENIAEAFTDNRVEYMTAISPLAYVEVFRGRALLLSGRYGDAAEAFDRAQRHIGGAYNENLFLEIDSGRTLSRSAIGLLDDWMQAAIEYGLPPRGDVLFWNDQSQETLDSTTPSLQRLGYLEAELDLVRQHCGRMLVFAAEMREVMSDLLNPAELIAEGKNSVSIIAVRPQKKIESQRFYRNSPFAL